MNLRPSWLENASVAIAESAINQFAPLLTSGFLLPIHTLRTPMPILTHKPGSLP